MSDLVTLAEAKAHCRVLDEDEDDLFALYIATASEAVRDIATDWDGTGDVPARIKLAVLSRVAIMFEGRDIAEGAKGEDRLLLPLRKLEV